LWLASCEALVAYGNVAPNAGLYQLCYGGIASQNERKPWCPNSGTAAFVIIAQNLPVGGVDVIRHFRDFMQSAPDELTAYAALLHGLDGSPIVGVIPCYCGNLAEGERVLAPLRSFGNPVMDTIQPLPFPAMQSILAGAFPDGSQNYWKSAVQRIA
jgi:hypothetical protein